MMHRDELRILQVSASDVSGGAERVAADLHRALLARDIDAHLAVGALRGATPGVIEIPGAMADATSMIGRLQRRIQRVIADPGSALDRLRGLEDFNFAGTRRLLSLLKDSPTVLHLHNLHGGYFDLRELPSLSRRIPTAITLHDTWLGAGHCAYAMACERWRTGCGSCPDLKRPLAIPRDSSAANWKRKREIYRRSRLVVAGPSRWVLRQAAESILGEAIVDAHHVPNGVDTTVFRPGDRARARLALGMDPDELIVAYTAGSERPNPFKDFASVIEAMPAVVAGVDGSRVRFAALGAGGEGISDPRILRLPYSTDPAVVAGYLQASNIYVHMAHGDNQPLAILEAQACAVPVIASAVGGIPEIVVDDRSGLLVGEGDVSALAQAVIALANDPARARAMGASAAAHVLEHHTIEHMVLGYLKMYESMIAGRPDTQGRLGKAVGV